MITSYTSATTAAFYQLKRNGTDVGNGTASGSRPGVIARSYYADNNVCETDPFFYLDSPASVSLLTYQIYIGNQGSGTVYVNRSANDSNDSSGARGSSSITVMEIAQ
jgi:hypothetical protein